jgi:hypothetical protein
MRSKTLLVKTEPKRKLFIGAIAILAIAIIGGIFITHSHATTPYASVETESGALSNGATKITDSTASGGSAVMFSDPSKTKLIVSVNNTIGWGPASNEPSALLKAAGVTWTRIDVGLDTDPSLIGTAISEGMHPFVMITGGTNDGNCNGVSSASLASAVTSLIPTLKADGLTTLEICNESYLTETDATYASQYNAAHVALAGTGIKALAVATALSSSCGAGDANPNWIPDIIKDLPGGASEVDGWTVHPYGPLSGTEFCSSNPNGYGWADVPDWHTIAVDAGSTAPWYITEVGQCIGNLSGQSGCNTIVSQATQASDMTEYLNDTLQQYTWVAYINWYTSCDDGSGEFGLVNREGGSPGGTGACDAGVRPAFTALQNWISANKNSLGD